MQAINNLADFWWQWMSSMFWQVSLLILFISVVDFFIRKWAWPQVRYALWLLILLKLFIPPTWSMRTSIVSNVQPRVQEHIVQRLPMTSLAPIQNKVDNAVAEKPAIHDDKMVATESPKDAETIPTAAYGIPSNEIRLTWQSFAMGFWLLGILLFSGLLIGKMARLRYWHKQQEKREIPKWFHEVLVKTARHFELTRLPAIVFNDKAITPAVYGLFRPVMLLPTKYFDNLSEEEAQHVLLHELAHLKRGDLWLHGLTLFMQIIYWFNPLLIWVRRQMKHVREICCDLTVANVLREKTPAYRQTLLNTARELLTETVEPGLGMLGVFEEPFRLVTRLKWLEKKTWEHRKKILGAAFVVSLLLAVSVLPMAGVSLDEAENESSRTMRSNNSVRKELSTLQPGEQWIAANFEIKNTNELYAAVLIKIGDPENQFENAVKECRALLKMQRIKPIGDPFWRLFSDTDEVPRERWYWEVGFQIKKNKKVTAPLEIRQVMPMHVASLGVAGVKNTEETWDTFIAQLDEHGYTPCFPPALEIYRGEKYDEPMWQYTEMQIPVMKKGVGYPGINIEYRTSDAFQAVVLPVHGSAGQFADRLQQLQKYLKKKGITSDDKIFAEYYYSLSESVPDDWEWLIGCRIENDMKVEEPFKVRSFPSTQIAAAFVNAPAQAEYPWSPFIYELIFSGYLPKGAARELWADVDKNDGRVEMQIPIMRFPGWSEDMPDFGADEKEWEEWGENLGTDVRQWSGNYSSDLVASITGYSIEELEAQTEKSISIRDKVEITNNILSKALLTQDVDTYAQYLMDDLVVNPPLAEEVIGKTAYVERMRDDARRGIKFRTFNTQIVECWQCGDEIYEIGHFSFSLTHPEANRPIVDSGNSFSIWQEDKDGRLKVKYTIFTTETHPSLR
jgi:bla regulator protein BlaR1